ncbi:MAG: DJ-1/PfpI family protein [Oscillospiraceae bacterium]|nr:DJ-1/PfpI family protein [Oscillospiraceae bacterium]
MVYVFLANGFEEVEALTPIDYLRRAGIEVTTVGVGTTMPKGAHGVTVMADISEDNFFPDDNTEAIVLPGGMPGTENLYASETVQRAARLGFGERDGFVIAAICAAPTILARLGLLKEHTATCYPSRVEELGASYRDADVIIDPPYLTARAAGQAAEFSLRLIEVLRGTEAAETVAKAVCQRR